MANYSFWVAKGKDLPTVENGHTFEMCNFTQLEPHTPILEGVTGLTFIKCNLTNCDVPVDATIDKCLHCHIEYCTNLHPKISDLMETPCNENCSHVVDTDSITIDGILVDAIYHYEDQGVE